MKSQAFGKKRQSTKKAGGGFGRTSVRRPSDAIGEDAAALSHDHIVEANDPQKPVAQMVDIDAATGTNKIGEIGETTGNTNQVEKISVLAASKLKDTFTADELRMADHAEVTNKITRLIESVTVSLDATISAQELTDLTTYLLNEAQSTIGPIGDNDGFDDKEEKTDDT
ncbi:MAG: hypothetical protein JKY57_01010, partial [Kordiimonadaceae bacterium]|nr:hypothetical protein [Kordiimonadaceae bacterium]